MFGLFKREEWKPEVISELKGSRNGLHVVLRNCPCLRDAAGEKRTYAYPDFGTDFLADLTDRQLGDFAHLQKLISYGSGKTVYVRLRDFPAIGVQVTGHGPLGDREFYSDLADALIAAFESHGIQP